MEFPDTKFCIGCETTKPGSEFLILRIAKTPVGRSAECNECIRNAWNQEASFEAMSFKKKLKLGIV